MDKQITSAIAYYAHKDDEFFKSGLTANFYVKYVEYCIADNVRPKSKSQVMKEVCNILGINTKRKYYSVFCEKVSK